MSDKIYVKHSLGSFQQPYLHQVATNNQTTSTGTTQGTTRGNTQQPSQYQNQGTTVVQQPVNTQTARQGSTQQPLSYIYQSPSIGNTVGNTRGVTQQPQIYQVSQPYPYIQPYTFQTATRYPYITNATGTSQGSSQGNTEGSTQGLTNAQGNTRYPFTYDIQTTVQSPSRYAFQTQNSTQGTTRYTYQSPSIAQGTTQQPSISNSQSTVRYPFIARYPFRYPFPYDYDVPTSGNTDIPITLEEKMFLVTPTLLNIRSIDLFSTPSNASQMRQDNFHFKTEIDTTNFSGKTVFRLYTRAATTGSPDTMQGSQNGTKTAFYETTHGESGIATGQTQYSTTFIELARYQIPSSYTDMTGYSIVISGKSNLATLGVATAAWLTHTDGNGTVSEAFPTNNLVTYYNNCQGFKVFSTNYMPSGFQLRCNSFGNAQTSWSTDSEIQLTVKLRSTTPSPDRTFTAGTNIRIKCAHDVTYQAGTPPVPGPGNPFPFPGQNFQQPAPPVPN